MPDQQTLQHDSSNWETCQCGQRGCPSSWPRVPVKYFGPPKTEPGAVTMNVRLWSQDYLDVLLETAELADAREQFARSGLDWCGITVDYSFDGRRIHRWSGRITRSDGGPQIEQAYNFLEYVKWPAAVGVEQKQPDVQVVAAQLRARPTAERMLPITREPQQFPGGWLGTDTAFDTAARALDEAIDARQLARPGIRFSAATSNLLRRPAGLCLYCDCTDFDQRACRDTGEDGR
ncbi:hypothetical protein I5J36_gp51 [Mycobacterium phage Mendokysei]|uniref:Uncharacterized protein n=1 Tax=Mycobacterium phage Mendokysei TaxID=2099637 RepID=A0A2P1CGC3_9CAUD|nr:hypothetical protein I5J36_gp51 [Mycobacterium phage Mendokysei]AVJ50267.1 hypothetical protein SEA_MENDOKYSEI_51 [Mycobacterium phage Mendokysei]